MYNRALNAKRESVMQNEGPEEGGFRAGIETGPDGKPTGNVICYPSFTPNCKVVTLPQSGVIDSTGFISLPSPAPYHDETLISVTAEINKMLGSVITKQGHGKAPLHVVFTSDGPMLVWARAMVTSADDIRKQSTQSMTM
jgi:hypothetical protein